MMTPWFCPMTGFQPPSEGSFLSGPLTDRFLRIRLSDYGLDPVKTARQLIEQADKISADALPHPLIQELASLQETIGEVPFYDALVHLASPQEFWNMDDLIAESVRIFMPDISLAIPSLDNMYRMASSSSAPPPLKSDPPSSQEGEPVQDSAVKTSAQDSFSWDQLSLEQLQKLLSGNRPQDIRGAALGVLIDRYRAGNLEALLTIAAGAEFSHGARIKLHDMVAASDITYRHLQKLYERAKQDPAMLRNLFFVFRSLADRINDDVAEQFKELISAGKMISLSNNQKRYFKRVIADLFDGDLSDWAKAGSEDAAEELLDRYLTLKNSDDDADRANANSALLELADAAHHTDYALECLFQAGYREAGFVDSEAWGEIDGLARENPRAADTLATAVEAGYRGNYYASLYGAAVESPYAALRLCAVANHLHDAGEFHLRDQVLVDLMDINLVRYREFAQTDPQAVEALVRLHQLGAKQARPTLEFVAPMNPQAQAALDNLDPEPDPDPDQNA